MSDAVAAPSAPAPSTNTAPAAAPPTERSAEDRLNDRVAEKRARAESAQREPSDVLAPPVDAKPSNTPERGVDGKFLPRGPVPPEQKTDAAPPADKPPEAKPSEDAAKLKAEGEAHRQRADKSEQEFARAKAQWDETAEAAHAHIEALNATIATLQQALKAAGGSIDPRAIENIQLKAQISTHTLAQERAQAAAQAQAEAQQRAQEAQALGALKSELATLVATHPELKPAPGAESLDFWRAVMKAHQSGGPAASLEMARALGPRMAAGIRATKAPAPTTPTVPARTLSNLGGTGGGAVKDLSPEGIRAKWAQRAQAG